MTIDAPPHSRWLLQESVDQLAASHDAATGAVAALARSAVGYGTATPQPALGPRMAGRRGWPRTAWLGVTALGTAVFLAWLSARLVRHLATAPVAVAVVPGLLLSLALAVTAVHAASPAEDPPTPGPVVLPWALFAAAAAGSVAWITLALIVTAGVAPGHGLRLRRRAGQRGRRRDAGPGPSGPARRRGRAPGPPGAPAAAGSAPPGRAAAA